jgi:hypothetical protein
MSSEWISTSGSVLACPAMNSVNDTLAAKRTAYLSRPDLFDEAERIWAPVYHSADAQEGPAAFRDKRPPIWTGR